MSRFSKISYDDDTKLVTVGAGCLFGDIYEAIWPNNIVGGGGTVGISGWILGGGYSLKTNQYGLGIDNLVQARIVLPNGKVVTANKDSEPLLFWAIKVCCNLDPQCESNK